MVTVANWIGHRLTIINKQGAPMKSKKNKKETKKFWFDFVVEKYPWVTPEDAKAMWHWLSDELCWGHRYKKEDSFNPDEVMDKILNNALRFRYWLAKFRFHVWWDKVFEDSWLESVYYWIWRRWDRNVKDPMFRAKMSKQRAKRGYADEDWWNLDTYLTTTLPTLFQALADNTQSTPCCAGELMRKSDPKKYKDLKDPDNTKDDEENREYWDLCHDWWVNHLREIAFCLREANEDTCSIQNEEEYFSKFHFERSKEDPYYSTMESDCTEEEEKQNEKHFKREIELGEYRRKMFEKAMGMIAELYGTMGD